MNKFFTIAVFSMALLSSTASAQFESPVSWTFSATKLKKGEANLQMKASLKPGWHVFSQQIKEGGPTATHFSFTLDKSFALVGATSEPKPIRYFEKLFNMEIAYFENVVVFQQKLKLLTPSATVNGKVEFMVCSAKECLPPEELAFSVKLPQ